MKAIQSYVQLQNKSFIVVSTTTMAAQRFHRRLTSSFTFKSPIPCCAPNFCNTSAERRMATNLQIVDSIIWSEVQIRLRHCFYAAHRAMWGLIRYWRPFGGNSILFSGNFRQILFMIEGGCRAQIIHTFFKTSPRYRQIWTLRFTENMHLRAFWNDSNSDTDMLRFSCYLRPSFKDSSHLTKWSKSHTLISSIPLE